jgi:hypothetical protein
LDVAERKVTFVPQVVPGAKDSKIKLEERNRVKFRNGKQAGRVVPQYRPERTADAKIAPPN